MKILAYSYREVQLYECHFRRDCDKYTFVIKAKKSKSIPSGIDDTLGNIPMSREEAIKKFKEKVDKHFLAEENNENFDDLLRMEDYYQENTGSLQWEDDKAFDGGY